MIKFLFTCAAVCAIAPNAFSFQYAGGDQLTQVMTCTTPGNANPNLPKYSLIMTEGGLAGLTQVSVVRSLGGVHSAYPFVLSENGGENDYTYSDRQGDNDFKLTLKDSLKVGVNTMAVMDLKINGAITEVIMTCQKSLSAY